jgi:hypothetical protein
MSLDPPAYLFNMQANIRTRPISWEGAMRAKTITDADLQKIKSIDKVRKEERKKRVEADVQSFVTLLLGGNGTQSIFEAAAKRQDIVQYMLVLTEDLINGTQAFCGCTCGVQLNSARHPQPHSSSYTTPVALQAFPTASQSYLECRRSHSTPHIFSALQIPVLCSHAIHKEHLPDR